MAHPRHGRIVDVLCADGSMSVDALAERLGVTPQTVRRDLRTLTRDGSVTRTRGIAMATACVGTTVASRRDTDALTSACRTEQHLCEIAAWQVPHGSTVLLGSGAVAEGIGAALARRGGVRVVTSSLKVAMSLSIAARDVEDTRADIEVIVAGGVVRPSDSALFGTHIRAFLTDYRADIAIVGVDGVGADGGMLIGDLDCAAVLRMIIEVAREVWLVADSARFSNVRGFTMVGQIGRMARVYTNAPLPASIAEICDGRAIEVSVAVPMSEEA